MDQQEFYKELVHRYVTNQATEEELETFFHLLESGEINAVLEAYLNEEAIRMAGEETEVVRRSSLLRRIAVAASVLIVLGVGLFVYQHNHQKTNAKQIAQNDIPPGTNKAILTLANGQKIVITDAKRGTIAQQGAAQISKTADGEIVYAEGEKPVSAEINMNTVETPVAAKTNITLSDGTKVWLDAESSIRFPASFSGGSREVATTGQVYFEVAHDAKKPFKVSTKGQAVEVLGTHFNINAYDDEASIKTTLLEGSVRISDNAQTALLKPGQQAVVKNSISVQQADVDEVTAWKNGDFVFNNENLQSIMRQLSRWYDIQVTYKDNNTGSLRFGGLVSRSKNISAVLSMMQSTGKIHFQINGRRVMVIAGKE